MADVKIQISAEIDKALSSFKSLANESSALLKKAADSQDKALKDQAAILNTIISQNKKLASDVSKFGKSEYQIKKENLKTKLAEIDVLKTQLKLEGKLAPEIEKQLDAQKKLLNVQEKQLDETHKNEKAIGLSKKSIFSAAGAMKALGAAAIAAGAAYLTFKAASKIFGPITDAASRQQDAVNSLNSALAVTGSFSVKASQDMQKFATSIQQTTRFGDEAVLEQLALAKSFGATNEQAKLVIRAATEYATRSGKSFDEATRQISKTLGGFAGELGELNPAIKSLSAEQLRAGAAARILLSQYDGSAAAAAKTFSGLTERLSNAFGDLFEVLGNVIIKNPKVLAAMESLLGVISNLTSSFEGSTFEATFKKIIDRFLDFGARVIPLVIRGFAYMVNGLSFVAKGFYPVLTVIEAAIRGFALLNKTLGNTDLASSLTGFADAINYDELQNTFKLVGDIAHGAADAAKEVGTAILNATSHSDDLTKSFEKTSEIAKKNKQLLGESGKNLEKQADILQQIVSENEKLATDVANVGASQEDQIKNNLKLQLSQLEVKYKELEAQNLINDKIKEQFNIQRNLLKESASKQIASQGKPAASNDSNGIVAAASNAVDIFTQGFDFIFKGGAVELVSSFVDGLANIPQSFAAVFDKFDQVALSLADNLATGIQSVIERLPEFFKKAIAALKDIGKVLIQALPEILAALADGFIDLVDVFIKDFIPKFIAKVPAIVSAIAERLPELIKVLADGIPEIVKALADNLSPVVEVLANNIGPVAEALVVGIIDAAPRIVAALVDSLIVRGGIVRIAIATVKAMSITLPIAIAKGIANGLSGFFTNIGPELARGFSKAVRFPSLKVPEPKWISSFQSALNGGKLIDTLQTIVNFLQSIADKIAQALGQGGGGVFGSIKSGNFGGAVDQALGGDKRRSILGFAEGGLVPGGFPNDTFPARLTSGELVIDRSTVDKLNNFIDQGGSQAAPSIIKLVVGEKELASVMYNMNRRGFRTA